MPLHPRAASILEFWFGPCEGAGPSYFPAEKSSLWFGGGLAMDEVPCDEITQKFAGDLELIASGEYDGWQATPLEAAAGIILMDQFSRNIYRKQAKSFALDAKARSWSDALVDSGAAKELLPVIRTVVFMTYMHAEDVAAQKVL